jgi:hypothetical protein
MKPRTKKGEEKCHVSTKRKKELLQLLARLHPQLPPLFKLHPQHLLCLFKPPHRLRVTDLHQTAQGAVKLTVEITYTPCGPVEARGPSRSAKRKKK